MRREFESYNRLVPPSDVGRLLRYARDPQGEPVRRETADCDGATGGKRHRPPALADYRSVPSTLGRPAMLGASR
jgi:hypothetical protein